LNGNEINSRSASLPKDPLQAKFRGFSCPQEGLDEDFLALVATKHARQIVQLFLERFHRDLTKQSRGVVELLERWLGSATKLDAVWHPTFEGAWTAIRLDSASRALEAAAGLSLHLGASGLYGEWSVTFHAPAQLRWSHWPLPIADRVCVACHEQTANIITVLGDAQSELSLTRTAEGWQGSSFEVVKQFGVNHKIALLSRRMLAKGFFDDLIPSAVSRVDARVVAISQDALGLLGKHAPVYVPWVERILRCIILLEDDDARMNSGSENGQSGVVYMSVSSSPMPFAELLVHEATHQYKHLLCRLGTIDDGTDKNLYYSPVVRRQRPLDRIVVAYHAFANILLLYRHCQASGVEDNGYCEQNEDLLVRSVRELEAPLCNNPALTPIGRALCEPLLERLGWSRNSTPLSDSAGVLPLYKTHNEL
jgi:hypothetical protein